MKKIIVLLVLILSLSAIADYDIKWHTIDGGGGVSSGGPYELIVTIGQPDVGNLAGGQYELLGGFLTGGPMCFVEFEDYARFAQYWLQTGSDLPGDLYKDEFDIVNWYDLEEFVYWWLNYCPYDWPL
jgi:hypothetical protein